MRNLILAAGTAALALAVPAAAEKGGKGGGHGHGGGKPAKVERGGGGGHGRGHLARAAKPPKAERPAYRAERHADREQRRTIRDERRHDHLASRPGDDRRDFRRIGKDERRSRDVGHPDPRFAGYDRSCPPGLARKGNGCLPPGQARKRFAQGQRIERARFDGYAIPAAYQGFYRDTPDYRYSYDDGGYIYRSDRGSDLISAIIPLLGGGFGIGQALPAGYDAYNLPMAYRDDYQDSDESLYRYGDNAIYEVDPQSGTIESIVALLAGDLDVGQALPDGYDAYNLPMDYRDEYRDGEDYNYRYADGNIYQVDAKSRMIQAIVEMLA